jgi:hypothetical protein
LPKVKVEYRVKVDAADKEDDYITNQDMVVLEVDLQLLNERSSFAHSIKYPDFREETWYVVVVNKS